MKHTLVVLMVLLLWVFSAALYAGPDCDKKATTINGLPLHVKALGDKAIRLWIGDHVSSTAVSALNTEKGIVVIDTTECPEVDKVFRKVIAKKFGRDDFITLINTHEHADHTNGNGVYADCEIIAHDTCAAGMKRSEADLKRVIAWSEENLPQLAKQVQEEKDPEKQRQLKETLVVRKMRLKTMKENPAQTFPTRAFKDKMTLDMGDMTLELYYMGGLHSASDIFILVPEEGLLFTGDVMADTWLTDTPGCLQSFGGRMGLKRDLNLMLENWRSLIERGDEIKHYIPGHWNGELSRKGFKERYAYLITLKEEVEKAAETGQGPDALLADLDLERRFPHLAGKPGFTHGFVHTNNILAMWTDVTGAGSASDALAMMIEKKGPEAALEKFKQGFKEGTLAKKYYFLEQDFNRLGYRYLNEEKADEAIAVFKLNAAMYPESWNVYDSLGEAYLKHGDKGLALKSYAKALELNTQQSEGEKKQYQIQKGIVQKLKEGK